MYFVHDIVIRNIMYIDHILIHADRSREIGSGDETPHTPKSPRDRTPGKSEHPQIFVDNQNLMHHALMHTYRI